MERQQTDCIYKSKEGPVAKKWDHVGYFENIKIFQNQTKPLDLQSDKVVGKNL